MGIEDGGFNLPQKKEKNSKDERKKGTGEFTPDEGSEQIPSLMGKWKVNEGEIEELFLENKKNAELKREEWEQKVESVDSFEENQVVIEAKATFEKGEWDIPGLESPKSIQNDPMFKDSAVELLKNGSFNIYDGVDYKDADYISNYTFCSSPYPAESFFSADGKKVEVGGEKGFLWAQHIGKIGRRNNSKQLEEYYRYEATEKISVGDWEKLKEKFGSVVLDHGYRNKDGEIEKAEYIKLYAHNGYPLLIVRKSEGDIEVVGGNEVQDLQLNVSNEFSYGSEYNELADKEEDSVVAYKIRAHKISKKENEIRSKEIGSLKNDFEKTVYLISAVWQH